MHTSIYSIYTFLYFTRTNSRKIIGNFTKLGLKILKSTASIAQICMYIQIVMLYKNCM